MQWFRQSLSVLVQFTRTRACDVLYHLWAILVAGDLVERVLGVSCNEDEKGRVLEQGDNQVSAAATTKHTAEQGGSHTL